MKMILLRAARSLAAITLLISISAFASPVGLSYSGDVSHVLGGIERSINAAEGHFDRFLNPSLSGSASSYLPQFRGETATLKSLDDRCKEAISNYSGDQCVAFKAARDLVQLQYKLAERVVKTVESSHGQKALMSGLLKVSNEADRQYAGMQKCVQRMESAFQKAGDTSGQNKARQIGSRLAQVKAKSAKRSAFAMMAAIKKRAASGGVTSACNAGQAMPQRVIEVVKKWARAARERSAALFTTVVSHVRR